MKLLSILLVLFVISQVFGGHSRVQRLSKPREITDRELCWENFKGKGCTDERECGPYGSCQIVGLVSFRSGLDGDGE